MPSLFFLLTDNSTTTHIEFTCMWRKIMDKVCLFVLLIKTKKYFLINKQAQKQAKSSFYSNIVQRISMNY